MEVITRSESQKRDLESLGHLYVRTTRDLNVRDYIKRQCDIYDAWCSTAMSSYLRKYAPEAGANLNRELGEVAADLEFIRCIFPELASEAVALDKAIKKCRAFHGQWLTNAYSLRQKTSVPKKLLC